MSDYNTDERDADERSDHAIDPDRLVPVQVVYNGDIKADRANSTLSPSKFQQNYNRWDTYLGDFTDSWDILKITHPIFITKILLNGVQQVLLQGFYVIFELQPHRVYYVEFEDMLGKQEQLTLEYLYTCNIPHAAWKDKYYEKFGCYPPVRDSVNILIAKVNSATTTEENNMLIVKENI